MASSSSSSAAGDGPSTSGRRSGRPQYWDWDFVLLPTTTRPKVTIYTSANDLLLQKVLVEVVKLNITGARRHANKLKEKGISLDEAVETLAIKNPKSRRQGPLHAAAWIGNLEMCKMLVKDFKCDTNATDDKGTTPLFFAIFGGGYQAVVKYLINNGADPMKANKSGFTPLHFAAEKGYYEIAKYLLSIGANVDPISKNGEAPLHVAATNGHAKMVKLLLKNKADINRHAHDGLNTPLVASVVSCSLECLQTLIEFRADVNTRSPVTPLSIAARLCLDDFIKCLLDYGADPNEPDEDGKLPLEIAASRKQEDCIEILLPVTNHLEKYANLSIAEMIEQESTAFQLEINRAIEDGDAAYWKGDYAHAVACYTKAARLGHDDALLFAKRSLCHLKRHDEVRFLDDAIYYLKKKEPDFSTPTPLFQEHAKKLVLEFGKSWKEAKAGGSGCLSTILCIQGGASVK